eukprot:587452-Hanusia_phi.AAC.8
MGDFLALRISKSVMTCDSDLDGYFITRYVTVDRRLPNHGYETVTKSRTGHRGDCSHQRGMARSQCWSEEDGQEGWGQGGGGAGGMGAGRWRSRIRRW